MGIYGKKLTQTVKNNFCFLKKIKEEDIASGFFWDYRLAEFKLLNGDIDYYDSFDDVVLMHVNDILRQDPNKIRILFSFLFRWSLDRCRLTKKELAEKIGITSGMLTHYAKGRLLPNVDKLNRISKALDIPIKAFLEAWDV